MRKIKFRVWDESPKKDRFSPIMINWDYVKNSDYLIGALNGKYPIMQFTGLKDKNGKEIFKGDIFRERYPYRAEQTHYGDNIPLGAYTEPLEPYIGENIGIVRFSKGSFRFDNDDDNVVVHPIINYDLAYAKELFNGGWSLNMWDYEEDGDLRYLLEEYNLKSEEELIKYLGVEVIGNIYENPELLNK